MMQCYRKGLIRTMVLGLGAGLVLASGVQAKVIVSEDFEAYPLGSQDNSTMGTGTSSGWYVSTPPNTSVEIVNTVDTSNSNALAFTDQNSSYTSYIERAFTGATNDFTMKYDMQVMGEAADNPGIMTGNQVAIILWDTSGDHMFNMRFTSWARMSAAYRNTSGGTTTEASISNVFYYRGYSADYDWLNHFTVTYDGEAGTLVIENPTRSFVRTYTDVATGMTIGKVRIGSAVTANADYASPQAYIDNFVLESGPTEIPEPATLSLLGLAGLAGWRRRR